MKIKQLFLMATIGLMATATFTSCEDILGEWDRPTPTNVTPIGGEGGGESAVKVTSITLDKTLLPMHVGGTDETLTATVKPDDATDKTVT